MLGNFVQKSIQNANLYASELWEGLRVRCESGVRSKRGYGVFLRNNQENFQWLWVSFFFKFIELWQWSWSTRKSASFLRSTPISHGVVIFFSTLSSSLFPLFCLRFFCCTVCLLVGDWFFRWLQNIVGVVAVTLPRKQEVCFVGFHFLSNNGNWGRSREQYNICVLRICICCKQTVSVVILFAQGRTLNLNEFGVNVEQMGFSFSCWGR